MRFRVSDPQGVAAKRRRLRSQSIEALRAAWLAKRSESAAARTGLLVANDGFFRNQDESGITSFDESSKAPDNAAIGKFGFVQKAVFHLCDAFIVYARMVEDGLLFD